MSALEDPIGASRPAASRRALTALFAASSPPEKLALAAAFVVMLAHAWHYAFLTDDAYISFRYARNLGDGFGLVFNPGFERVEGYTNFLWVLLLAGPSALGLAPHQLAIPLSLALTALYFAVVAAFAARWAPPGSAGATAAIATALLAVTPSVAVWSTSGLETRLFELLVVAGVFALLAEDERMSRGEPVRLPAAAGLLALATWTRPDGLLIAACALGVLVVWRARELPARLAWTLRSAGTYASVVGAHFAFRMAYYGAWLPNTYYAKVDGQTWWSLGARYLEAFALEHALYLWIPLLAAGALSHLRRGSRSVPLLFAAVCVPHAVYVASIGGDHFEWRPLDLYLAFLFLLVAQGTADPLRGRRLAAARAIWLVLVAAVAFELPYRAHAEFPDDFRHGFPGGYETDPLAEAYLDPQGNHLHRLPGLRRAAARHRQLLREIALHYAGLRREEHVLFAAAAVREGRELGALVAQGVLPPDTHVAICCVGAIPYYSNLRVLDRIGLTDAQVARGGVVQPNLVAHKKSATRRYGRERGVDLWSVDPVHLLFDPRNQAFAQGLRDLHRSGRDVYFARLAPDRFLVAELLQGAEHARRKFQPLRLESTRDARAVGAALRSLRDP